MSRALFVLALLGLAIGAQLPSELRYRYDGQLSISLPSSPSAATRLRCDVIIHPTSDRQFQLMLKDFIFAVSKDIDCDKTRISPIEELDQVKLEKEQMEILGKPISFTYTHGLISDVFFTEEEKPWTANIKRAVLNMIQVDISKAESDKKEESGFSIERTIEGECETGYSKEIIKGVEHWTKTVNLNKCASRPVTRYGRRMVTPCEWCEKANGDDKTSTSVYSFNMTVEDKIPLISSVFVASRHLFADIDDSQMIVARAFAKMEMIYSGERKNRMPEVVTSIKELLVYNDEIERAEEEFAKTGDEKFLKRIPQWNNQVDLVRQTMSKLNRQMADGVHVEASHHIARLVKLLRFCTEEHLRQIERSIEDNVVAIFDDALAMAGTKLTLERLFDRIQKNIVSPVKASQLMKTVAELRIPSMPIVEKFYSFCESSVVAREAHLRQSCWLSYGSVMNAVCGSNSLDKWADKNKICTRSTKDKLVRDIVDKINRADGHYDKVLFIKTLANAGIDVSIPELEKIIKDSLDTPLRVQAVDALRRLRTTMPRKLINLLMPIYKDNRLPQELRITCLNIILQCQPEQYVLDNIVDGLRNERSRHVRTFTYSTLSTMSESLNPCEKLTAQRCSKALKTIPELKEETMWRSRFERTDKFNWEHGISFSFASMFSNDSFLPKEVMASMDNLLSGNWNKNLFQIGVTQNSIDSVLAQLLQKVEENGIEELIVRQKRSSIFNPSEIIRNLVNRLRIGRRQVEPQEPRAMLYFRYKDMDYAFLPMDLETIPEVIKSMVRDGKLDISEIESVLASGSKFSPSIAGFLHETSRSLPTILGLPIWMSSKMPTIATVRGEVSMNMLPEKSENFNGVRFNVRAQSHIASTHVVKVETFSPIASTGFKLLHSGRFHLPIDMELLVNWENDVVIKTTFKPVEEKKHLLHISSRPLTYVRHWKKSHLQYPEPIEASLVMDYTKSPVHSYEVDYLRTFGLKMKVIGHMRQPIIFSDSTIDVLLEPTEKTPKEYSFRMLMNLFEPIENIEKPSMELLKKKSDKLNVKVNEAISALNLQKGVEHKIDILAEMVGSEKTAIEMRFHAMCSMDMRFCRLAHTTKSRELRHPIDFSADIEVIVPKTPSSLKQFKEQELRDMLIEVNSRWGRDQTVSVAIVGTQSELQRKWIERAERGQNQLVEQQKLKRAGQLNEFNAVVEYHITRVPVVFGRVMDFVKSFYFMKTSVLPFDQREEIVFARVIVEPKTRNLFNMTLQIPSQQISIVNAKVPLRLPLVTLGTKSSEMTIHKIAKRVESESRAICTLKKNEVKTFDELVYRAPMTKCYSVMAKDCHNEKPRFVVLVKNINEGKKALKVIDDERVITIEPKNELVVKINGEITENFEEFGINKHGEVFTIELEDIQIRFDGVDVETKLSPFFMNKQCGLCGHYDGEDKNELRTADNEETSDLEKFHRSFIFEDEECDREENRLSDKKNYKFLTEETSSSEEMTEEGTQEPIERNRIIERSNKMCFSTEAVKTCPKGTEYSDIKKVETAFKCIPRNGAEALRLKGWVEQGIDVSEEVQELSKNDDWSSIISIPSVCVY